jgi:hypothetical protein
MLGRVILFELHAARTRSSSRSSGSQLRDHADFEAMGMNLRNLTPPEEWPVRRWRMNAAATLPCDAWMVNIDTRTRSGDPVAFETVTLPIEPDEPEKPRLLMSKVGILGGIYDAPAEGR